jgi:hypothetical protein
LAGGPDGEEEEAFERELAREREWASRHASRRGSVVPLDDDVAGLASPSASRFGSRSHSRVGSRTQVMTPLEYRATEGYFAQQVDESVDGPDFVNLDARLEAIEQDTSQEDEAHVRRLVKRGNAGVGTWFGSVLGWGLFSVEENEEEEEEEEDCDGEDTECGTDDLSQERRKSSVRQFDGAATAAEERMPPPRPDEGGWQDAAWLLSVASKVLL